MRTLIDLPDDQARALDALAQENQTSRAALVREAVGDVLARRPRTGIAAAFGLRGRDGEDGLAYQARVRAGW
jgi:predicted transcriptional regulator